MIPQKRTIPLSLQQIIALRSRLTVNHPKQLRLEKSELKRWAGYHGELTVDKYIERAGIAERFTIFQDVNLTDRKGFQIDTFLFNPFFGLILEIKNILGTLYFDKYSNQMIRTYKGEKEGFTNPLLQTQMNLLLLQNWLNKHKIPPIPIEWLVVFSNPATILETTPGNEPIFEKVIHTHLLLEKISQLEAKYTSPEINKATSKKLTHYLLTENTPFLTNILQKYEIAQTDVKTGVRCPECNFVPMVRTSGNWYCPKCKMYSKHAHMPSIYDFLLINQPAITNHQCREFLHMPSRSAVHSYLSAFPMTGSTKTASYQLNKLLQNPNEYFLLPKNKMNSFSC